jgi:sec-independent protein translocase protein TatA
MHLQTVFTHSEGTRMPIGPMELVIILILALIVLGPKRLPDAGRSLGRGIREFKGAIDGSADESPEKREARRLERKAEEAEARAI